MRTVEITARCTGTITETWRATVPDDWTDAQVEEAFGGSEIDVEFVRETTDDERDREVVKVEGVRS